MTTEEQLEQVGDLGIELNASSRLTSSSIPPKDMDDSFESNLSQNNQNQRPTGRNLHLLQLQVAVPCKSHKHVGNHQ